VVGREFGGKKANGQLQLRAENQMKRRRESVRHCSSEKGGQEKKPIDRTNMVGNERCGSRQRLKLWVRGAKIKRKRGRQVCGDSQEERLHDGQNWCLGTPIGTCCGGKRNRRRGNCLELRGEKGEDERLNWDRKRSGENFPKSAGAREVDAGAKNLRA